MTIIITGKANTNITFDQATKVYMNENAGIGYNVITVTARDPNNNAVTSYEMIQQPSISSSHFDVKANGKQSVCSVFFCVFVCVWAFFFLF